MLAATGSIFGWAQMGSSQRIGDVTVSSVKRKRGGRLKKLEWRGRQFCLVVPMRYEGSADRYMLDPDLCRCDTHNGKQAWGSVVEVAENILVCGSCDSVIFGTLRIVVGSIPGETARLAALLAHWGEDPLTADIGASALMDAAAHLVKRYERYGLPDHVKTFAW